MKDCSQRPACANAVGIALQVLRELAGHADGALRQRLLGMGVQAPLLYAADMKHNLPLLVGDTANLAVTVTHLTPI